MSDLKHLTCCCCGSYTTGRQWHDRDTGYGLCDRCAVSIYNHWIFGRQRERRYFARKYGQAGFHHSINSPYSPATLGLE